MNWIRTDKQLPKELQLVAGLASLGRKSVAFIGYHDNEIWYSKYLNNHALRFPTVDNVVTHWYPLPKIPEDNKECLHELTFDITLEGHGLVNVCAHCKLARQYPLKEA